MAHTVKLAGQDEFGVFHEKQLDHIIEDLKIYYRIFHGPDAGLDEGDSDLQLIETVAPELRLMWAGLGGAILQAYITTAVGEGLEKACAILRITRRLATKATGEITFQRDTAAPTGGVLIPAGTIIATDADVRFATDADVTIPAGGTSATIGITALEAGVAGNVASATITTFISTVLSVDSMTNVDATSGGADKESDASLRARALNDPATRGRATPRAIKSQIETVAGVERVSVIPNNSNVVSADEIAAQFTGTGTNSAVIDASGANTKIAWKFTIAAPGAWVQDVRFNLTNVTGLTLTARIEEDSAGSPTGALHDSNHEKTGIAAANGDNLVHFASPGFLAAGDYHLALIPTAGSFTLDGAGTGTADQVKIFTGGAYTATGALIENGNIDILSGRPPHCVEVYVTGGVDADIAERLFDVVAGGVDTWGKDIEETITDASGNTQTVRASRPTTVSIYVSVTIVTNDDWDATNGPNAVRDAIVTYLGGTDSHGNILPGLNPGDDVERSEIIAAVMGVTGVQSVTLSALKIDTVNPPVDTSANAITIGPTQVARAESPSSGIDVTVS